MKILIVGSGGREHALGWKLKQSPLVTEIIAAPGNPGLAELGRCVAIKADDARELAAFALREQIDWDELWRRTAESPFARTFFNAEVFRTPSVAGKFLKQPHAVLHALVNLDPERGRALAPIEQGFRSREAPFEVLTGRA